MMLAAFACLIFGFVASIAHAAVQDQVSERLAAIAGRDETISFEATDTDSSFTCTWIFNGLDIAPEQMRSTSSLDLGIDIRPKGIVGHATDSLVLDFAHEGALPAPAILSVALPPSLVPAESLSLYAFDERAQRYVLLQGDLVSTGGLVSFSITHCSALVLSVADLAALGEGVGPLPLDVDASDVPATGVAVAGVASSDARDESFSFSVFSWQVYVVLGFVTAVAITLFVLRRYRRARESAVMQQGWVTDSGLSAIDFSSMPSFDDPIEGGIEEPKA
jgi:hypothetical protein